MFAVVLGVGGLVGACERDSVAAPEVAAEIGSRDLEVWVPPLTPPASASQATPIPWPAEWSPEVGGAVSIRSGTTEPTGTSAYIAGTFVVAGWTGDELWYQYGMSGLGTGYSMKPNIRISKPDGSELYSENGTGIQLHLSPIPVSFTPAMQEVFRTGVFCGLTANVSVEFRSFIGVEFEKFSLALSASKTGRAASSQPACPTSPPGSGAPGGGSGGTITYCRYEAYFTSWGELIAINFLGCSSHPINAA